MERISTPVFRRSVPANSQESSTGLLANSPESSTGVPGNSVEQRTCSLVSSFERNLHNSAELGVVLTSILLIIEFIRSPRMSRVKNWCFTLNNYTQADEDRLATLGTTVAYIIIGKEIGDQGTPHLQGFVSFNERKRLAQVIAVIGQAHCTPARNVPASIEYCKKDGNFSEHGTAPTNRGGQGSRNDISAFKEDVKEGMLSIREIREKHSEVYAKYKSFCIEYVNDHAPQKTIPDHPYSEWQQSLFDKIEAPADDRTIIFVVDKTGNSGKSWFAHHYTSKKDGGAQVMLPGKKADMSYALETEIRVLFVDAPRSKQGEFIQYDFLEDIKNGYVFSTKYESRVKRLNQCHVVVMMNEFPDLMKLSQDRYDIIEI